MINAPDSVGQLATGLARVAQLLENSITATAGAVGLSALQLQILSDLLARGETLTVTFLAQRYMVSAATVSDSVRVLTAKGLVAKSRDRQDARSVQISITAPGKVAAQTFSVWMNYVCETVSKWDENRQGEVLSALLSVIDGIQREGGSPTDRMCISCRYLAINCDVKDNSAPYYCRFFGSPLRPVDLRIDCPEFEP